MVEVRKGEDTIICKGGIKLEVAQQIMTKTLQNHTTTYLQSLPSEHQHIGTETINKQINQFRYYIIISVLVFITNTKLI